MANNKRGYKRRAFTTGDVRYIRSNILDMQLKDIADFLGRPRQSVSFLMKKLGIKRVDE